MEGVAMIEGKGEGGSEGWWYLCELCLVLLLPLPQTALPLQHHTLTTIQQSRAASRHHETVGEGEWAPTKHQDMRPVEQ